MEEFYRRKLSQSKGETRVKGILGGFFIGLAAIFFLVVKSSNASPLLGGLVFSLGLMLCAGLNANLFTGDIMMAFSGQDLSFYLPAIYGYNCLGAFLVAFIFMLSGITPEATTEVAMSKIYLSPGEIFWRAFLCDILVCLAVLLSMRCKTVIGKMIAVIPPVTCFVACSFEHCIAQCTFLGLALLQGAEFGIGRMAITILLTTLGNIVGGLVVSFIFAKVLKGDNIG